MELIYPDWPGIHPALPDPRPTLLVPFGRELPILAPEQQLVLDSGAFARSFQKPADRAPVQEWMRDLAAWYREARAIYGERLRWCVAPDVFGDPRATWQQWCMWQEASPDVPVAPVIQLWPGKPLDLYTIQQEAKRYGVQPVVCLSNPAKITAARWGSALEAACSLIRDACGQECWIHLLGAGWSQEDVIGYARVPGLDSIDSITYYLAAERGERWCRCSDCTLVSPWQQAALHHAQVLERLRTRL